MAVYFVYRCHYMGPSEKYVKRFEDATVLDWFRRIWVGCDDEESWEYVKELIGHRIYGFDSLFRAIREHELEPPRSEAQLHEYLEEHLYVEGEIEADSHVIQVVTDDDELQMAYYIFDDRFLAKRGKRAAFLLNDGWELPGGSGDKRFWPQESLDVLGTGDGKGTTYLAILAFYDSGNLDDIEGPRAFEGVRLPDLARHLLVNEPIDSPRELTELRSNLLVVPRKVDRQEKAFLQSLQKNPDDDATWAAYADWLTEQGESAPGIHLLRRALAHSQPCVEWAGKPNPKQNLIHVEDHLAQACLHAGTIDSAHYHQWIFFDDRWAGVHSDLANGVLRFAARWDVLSTE